MFYLLESTVRSVRLRYRDRNSSLFWDRSSESASPAVQSIEWCRRFMGTYRWLSSPCWVCNIESVPDARSLLIVVVGMLLGHERKTDRESAWADVLTEDLDSVVSNRTSDGLGCWTRRPARKASTFPFLHSSRHGFRIHQAHRYAGSADDPMQHVRSGSTY